MLYLKLSLFLGKRSVGGMPKDCKTSDNGFYGTGARTDNLSDEMKLSIRGLFATIN